MKKQEILANRNEPDDLPSFMPVAVYTVVLVDENMIPVCSVMGTMREIYDDFTQSIKDMPDMDEGTINGKIYVLAVTFYNKMAFSADDLHVGNYSYDFLFLADFKSLIYSAGDFKTFLSQTSIEVFMREDSEVTQKYFDFVFPREVRLNEIQDDTDGED